MIAVDIYTNENLAGRITYDPGKGFSLAPEGSKILKGIMALPVFSSRDGRIVDIFAHTEPETFMRYLPRHYRSQGLRAAHVHDDGTSTPPQPGANLAPPSAS